MYRSRLRKKCFTKISQFEDKDSVDCTKNTKLRVAK